MNSAQFRLGALLVLSSLGIAGCGPEGGTGPFGSYDARVAIRSENVTESREGVRTIVERNHEGVLEGENTDTDSGPFDFKELSVLTFRLPADQIDAAIGELDGGGVGKVTARERGNADQADTRSDLAKVSETINDQIAELTSSPDERLANAQAELERLAERANLPVLVVEINPEPSLFDYGWGFTTNRLVWVILAVALASRLASASKNKVISTLEYEKKRQERDVKGIANEVAKKVVEATKADAQANEQAKRQASGQTKSEAKGQGSGASDTSGRGAGTDSASRTAERDGADAAAGSSPRSDRTEDDTEVFPPFSSAQADPSESGEPNEGYDDLDEYPPED
jgi:hypothetical protein